MSRLSALISGIYSHRTGSRAATQSIHPVSTGSELKPPVVWLVPGYQPLGEVERHIYAILSNGPMPLDTLVDEVAERLLHTEVERGGWAADIGIVGSCVYRPQVTDMVTALNGLMLRIEPLWAETSGHSS